MNNITITQLSEAERISRLIGSSCLIRNKPKNWKWKSEQATKQSVLSRKKNL